MGFHDGTPTEILNCQPPPPDTEYRCAALYCEKALYERKVVRPYTRVAVLRHQHHFNDTPGRSVHYATWTHEEKPVVAKCEMQGYEVISIDLLERMPE